MATLIASGGMTDLTHLGRHEGAFAENDRGYLSVNMRSPVAAEMAKGLSDTLTGMGISGHKVTASGKVLRIDFQKKLAPLAIIAAAIAVSIVLVMLVVSWKLFKLSPGAVTATAGIIFVIALAIAGVVAYVYLRKKGV